MLFFTLKENIEKNEQKTKELNGHHKIKVYNQFMLKLKHTILWHTSFSVFTSPPLLLSLKFCFLVPLPIYIENETSIYIYYMLGCLFICTQENEIQT